MSFRRVKYMEMKVLQFHQVCLDLQRVPYPLKYPTVNSIKLSQTTLCSKLMNSLTTDLEFL